MCICLFYKCTKELNIGLDFTRNCEDIAMSFLVANATGAPPIWVKGNHISYANLNTWF